MKRETKLFIWGCLLIIGGFLLILSSYTAILFAEGANAGIAGVGLIIGLLLWVWGAIVIDRTTDK